jgi:hypothetical protein
MQVSFACLGGCTVWFSQETYMLKSVSDRWDALPAEDRIVLECAYRDAIAKPHRVGSYRFDIRRLSGQLISIHEFRFGYATFTLADTQFGPIMIDFHLDNRIAKAAE